MRDNNYEIDQLFFLDNFDDTSKIFIQNIVIIKFRFEKIIVLVVAFSSIAITLLNDDSIVYSRFKILLNFNFQNVYNISKKTNRVELLKIAKLIF